MKRQTFINVLSLSGMALTTIPHLAFNTFSPNISSEELIGKGDPILFGEGYQLRKVAHHAFLRMKTEALKSGINIETVSSYRSFSHQKRIWDRKFNRYQKRGFTEEKTIKKIIEYSTIPGTSRHHWGTDIDIIDGNVKQPKNVLQEKHFNNRGSFVDLKNWLDKYANSFGFYLVYTQIPERRGFKYEPWHYSYKSLSKLYLKAYRELDISEILKQERLIGSSSFSKEFVNQYWKENILDINPELL